MSPSPDILFRQRKYNVIFYFDRGSYFDNYTLLAKAQKEAYEKREKEKAKQARTQVSNLL